MYARIVWDLINYDDDIPSRADTNFGSGTVEGVMHSIRLLDDDRIPYYIGFADDGALEVIFLWSQRDAGTTILQTLNLRTLKWEDCIS